MIDLTKIIMFNAINKAGKNQFGKDIIVDGKIDIFSLGYFSYKLKNANKINVEIKQNYYFEEDESIIELEEDKIIINSSAEVYIDTVVKLINSEFDMILTPRDNAYTHHQDEKIAKIISAENKYKQASETKDASFKIEVLKDAQYTLMDAISEMELQIKADGNRIDAIPRNFVQRIYKPKIKSEDIDELINNTREILEYYARGLALMNIINSKLGEIDRLDETLDGGKIFLKGTFTKDRQKRLNYIDAKKDDFIIKKVDEILAYIDSIKKAICEKSKSYLLEI